MYQNESQLHLRGRVVTERVLMKRSGTEGCAHDPYGWDEYTVILNGVDITLRISGLGYETLTICDREVETKCGAEAEFHKLTGIDPCEFEELYYRVHPYYPDPMGGPGLYR